MFGVLVFGLLWLVVELVTYWWWVISFLAWLLVGWDTFGSVWWVLSVLFICFTCIGFWFGLLLIVFILWFTGGFFVYLTCGTVVYLTLWNSWCFTVYAILLWIGGLVGDLLCFIVLVVRLECLVCFRLLFWFGWLFWFCVLFCMLAVCGFWLIVFD